jgi:two-component system, cell cycle response regulator
MISDRTGSAKGKVLVVDDLSDNRLYLSAVLGEQGYEVRCLSSAEELLVKQEASLSDLILLDINAENERSHAIWEELNDTCLAAQISVIAIDPSEYTLTKLIADATVGVDYIRKPFRAAEVLTRVENLLTMQRLQRQFQDSQAHIDRETRDRHTTEQALARSRIDFKNIEERTNVLLDAIPDKIFRHHLDGSFLDIKGQSADLILPREAIIGNNLRDLPIPDRIKADLLELIELTIFTGQPQTYVHQLLKQDGMHVYESRFAKSGIDEAVCIVRDITERQRTESALQKANQELERLAHLDGLTEIANRRQFDAYLRQEWLRLAREQAPLSLILCDVDFFKNYNDTYGHLAGDGCLQQVAKAITSVVKRPADLAARYGGEEFAVILPNTNLVGAAHIAKQIRRSVKGLDICHDTSQVGSHVTLSLGVTSMIPIADAEPKVLVDVADCALYQAKQKGRDRLFAIWSKESQTKNSSISGSSA